MINKYDVARALATRSKEVATDNSYNLVAEGKQYTPDVNASYIEEHVIYGKDAPMSLDNESKFYMVGIYQIDVNTPRSSISCKYDGLLIAGVFQTAFSRGTVLTSNGQSLRVKSSSIKPLEYNETHLLHALSITFDVIN
jgi:hypothetical protein